MASDNCKGLVKATVYSSETDAWSTPVTLDSGCQVYAQHCKDALIRPHRFYYIPYVQPRRGAVVGDEAYFTLRWANGIVRYNWAKNRISMIDPPSRDAYYIALMEMEDSALGLVCIRGSSLYLGSRNVSSEADAAAEWVECRVIELEGLIPGAEQNDEALVVGSAEGVGVIFVATGAGLFTIGLKSGQVRKVDEPKAYFSIIPYMSFYTPGIVQALGAQP
jgi:hypothetical protein